MAFNYDEIKKWLKSRASATSNAKNWLELVAQAAGELLDEYPTDESGNTIKKGTHENAKGSPTSS